METRGPRPIEEELFLGRNDELQRLGQGLHLSREGTAQVCLVGGSSGIGKTALARRFLESISEGHGATGGVTVLQARCFERESAPFKPVEALLQDLVRRVASMEGVRPALRPSPDLEQMFPVLSALHGERSRRPTVDARAEPLARRQRAFEALRELFATLREHTTVVLFVDDLHWADEDTLALLQQLVSAEDAPGLLFLATFRTERLEGTHAFEAFLDRCDALGCRRMELVPLPQADTENLARGLLKREVSPDASQWEVLVHRIARESEGSPLLVSELVRYLRRRLAGRTAGSAASLDSAQFVALELHEVLHARIIELPERVRRVLEVIAVAGDPVPQAVVKDAVGGEAALAEWMTRLRAEGLVRSHGRGERDDVDTLHDRIREAVIIHLDLDRRGEIHRRLAEAMQRFDPDRVDFLARHWQAAGEESRALHYLVEVAQRAARQLAFERAAELYRQAIDMEPDAEQRSTLEEALGEALANLGRLREAAEAYLAAAEAADPERRQALRLRAGEQLIRGGHMARGFEVLGEVLRDMGFPLLKTPNRAVISILRNRVWLVFRGLKLRPRDDTPLTVLDALYAAATYISVVDTIHGADLENRYLRQAASAGHEGHFGLALALEGTHQATHGPKRYDRALALLQRGAPLVETFGDRRREGMLPLGRGMSAYFTGHWQEAHDQLGRAEAAFLDHGLDVHWELATVRMWYCFSLIQLGEFPELLRRYDDHVEEAIRFGNHYAAGSMRTRLNVVWLMRGDLARAEEDVSHLLETYPTGSYQVQHFWHLHGRCDGLVYLGRGAEALEQLDREWRQIKKAQLHRVLMVRAEIQSLVGRAALSAAARASDPGEKAAFLKRGRQAARALRREKAQFAQAWGAVIEAGLAQQSAGAEAGLVAVERALEQVQAAECPLHVATLRVVRGELTESAAHREEGVAALHWLAQRDVADPRRLVELIATGLGDPLPEVDA